MRPAGPSAISRDSIGAPAARPTPMPKIARSDIVVPNKLDPAARQGFIDALYKVHCEVFDGVSRDSFAKYVVESQAEQTWISGAEVYAELIGYGVSSDANHITEPDPWANPAPRCRWRRRRRHRPVRDRLHQRPRHLHAARRRLRDARDQLRGGRGERVQDPGPLDEGRHRPLPRRRRRDPVDLYHPRDAASASCRRRSTTRSRIPSATSTTSRTRRARARSRSASRTRSASAGTTPVSCSAASTSDSVTHDQ